MTILKLISLLMGVIVAALHGQKPVKMLLLPMMQSIVVLTVPLKQLPIFAKDSIHD